MSVPEGPVSLAENVCTKLSVGYSKVEEQILTHGHTQQANANLDACSYEKDLPRTSFDQPVVRKVGEEEAEKVLEHEEASEYLDCDLALSKSAAGYSR